MFLFDNLLISQRSHYNEDLFAHIGIEFPPSKSPFSYQSGKDKIIVFLSDSCSFIKDSTKPIPFNGNITRTDIDGYIILLSDGTHIKVIEMAFNGKEKGHKCIEKFKWYMTISVSSQIGNSQEKIDKSNLFLHWDETLYKNQNISNLLNSFRLLNTENPTQPVHISSAYLKLPTKPVQDNLSSQHILGNTLGGGNAATNPTTMFGGGNTATNPTTMFGGGNATTNPTTMFGGTTTAPTNPTTMFGGGNTATNPTTMFGGGNTAPTNPTTNMFGGGNTAPSNPTTMFGGGNTAPTNPTTMFRGTTFTNPTNMFGSTTTSNPLFTTKNNNNTFQSSLFHTPSHKNKKKN